MLFLADGVVNQIIKCLIPRSGVAANCVVNILSKLCANAISTNIQVMPGPFLLKSFFAGMNFDVLLWGTDTSYSGKKLRKIVHLDAYLAINIDRIIKLSSFLFHKVACCNFLPFSQYILFAEKIMHEYFLNFVI